MFKNRFLLILGVLSLLLVAMAVSRPFSKTPKSADLSLPPRPVMIPMAGANNLSDYHERHLERRATVAPTTDTASDFYLRHPKWSSNVQGAAISVTGNLERPGMACESPVDCR